MRRGGSEGSTSTTALELGLPGRLGSVITLSYKRTSGTRKGGITRITLRILLADFISYLKFLMMWTSDHSQSKIRYWLGL